MPIIEKTVTETRVVRQHQCDWCEVHTNTNQCKICQSIICSKHANFHDNGSDHWDRYCPRCWPIFKEHQARIAEIEHEAESRIESVNTEMLAKCREAAAKAVEQ